MSVDPWSWGDDNSDQDWNNGWSNQDFQQNVKGVTGFGNAPPTFGSNNNAQQAMDHHSQTVSHQNIQRSSGWAHPTTQSNSTADYFSNKPPLNNNPFPDVENKEIAPPDYHHLNAGHRQPMKLGSKQPHSDLSAMKNTQENSAHFDNVQHSSALPQEQHHSVQQLPSSEYLQHGTQHSSSRNQTHHYFSNSQQNFFNSNDSQMGNSWSYFDQSGSAPNLQPQSLPMFDASLDYVQQSLPFNQPSCPPNHQPQSLPPNQGNYPPQPTSVHPQSLPQNQGGGPLQSLPPSFPLGQAVTSPFQSAPQEPLSVAPNSTFQERQSLNEPKNFSYFHMQDSHLADHDISHNKPSSNQEPLTYCIEEPVDSRQSTTACPENTSQQLPHNSHQNLENNTIPHESQNRGESHTPQVTNDLSNRRLIDNPILTQPDESFDQCPPKSIAVKPSTPRSPDSNNMCQQEIPIPPIPIHEERLSVQGQESPGPQGFIEPDRPRSHERTIQPTAADSNQLGLQGPDRSLPPPPPQARLEPERAGSQGREWSAAQPKRHMERPPSQGKESSVTKSSERLERLPPSSQPERPPSRDWPKSQTQTDRPSLQGQDWPPNSLPPQQMDRSNSQGRDWPLQPPQHSDNSVPQARKWSGPQLSERSGSQGRDWPGSYGTDRSGSQEKMSHHRTPSQGSDRSGSAGRGSGPRVDRSDVVTNRSPGAGEDRTSPPARPDNMESLPPDPHITHQMNQLSLQPSDKLDDCPLDRNEYLETSQLSNQETTNNDTRISRHQPTDFSRSSHRGERREVVGEAEPLAGRVVLGHTTPTTTPPPNHSDEVDGGGSGSMERMVVGERREQTSRNNRSSRQRNHHRRESSFEEDEQDYSSDNRRGHRDDYSRREERHRKKRGQDQRCIDYISDEEYEIDRRVYSRRDRRGRDRDYSPEYRRDYYRDDDRRGGRGAREYYRYEDDDYSFRERSRPSSRSGSDYRRTNLEYNSRNQSRHNYFNSSIAGMFGGREYETNPDYFEMLRKTDPMLYAVWYQFYMRKLQDTAAHSAFTQSDRASIHSGQSSGNRIHVSTPNQALDSNIAADSFEDYSPRLFSTPHVRGCYDGQGRLVVVNACSPLDGQPASVQLLSVDSDYQDQDVEEFLESPGPFIPGVTHRSSVLQYLRKMSDQANKGSEKILYDLVHLIVKSNGKPDASDLSELLLESYRNSRGDSKDQWDPDPSVPQPISHQDMLSRFRSLLHQGNKQEALDWAMKHGGWGHALFLASKMDARTQNRVAGEFARSLAPCDPLSTLYQVLSGSIPAAATACSDNRWADWRPHLAMVLSNLTDRAATDLSTITTLAEGLASRGRIHAAHSCHIIAQVMFGDLYRNEGPILLGWTDPAISQQAPVSQSHTPVESFCYRSFLLTLCYEYAVKQGQPNFYIPALQKYKLLMAWRLVEWGRGREALLYCELLGSELLHGASDGNSLTQHADLVHLIVDLSSSLKALDPLAPPAATDLFMTPDSDWLQRLKQYAMTLPVEESEPQLSTMSQPESLKYSNFEPHPHVPLYHTGGGINGGFSGQMRVDDPQILSAPEPAEPPIQTPAPVKPVAEFHPSTQPLSSHQMPPVQTQMQPPLQQPNSMPPISAPLSFQPTFTSQPPSFTGYEDGGSTEVDHTGDSGGVIKPAVWEPEHQPETSTQQMAKSSTNYFHTSENLLQGLGDGGKTVKSSQPAAGPESSKRKPDALGGNNGNGGSGGWFGGIFGKLSMKPKNQMVLPDDKDPKIVFDPKLKRWIDRDSEDGDSAKDLKPPPMINQSLPPGNGNMPLPAVLPAGKPAIPSGAPSMPFGSGPPLANSTNKYKLQKGKSMKSNYVDLLSSSGSSSKVSGNMEPMVPSMAPHSDAVNSNFYASQPVGNTEGSGSQIPNESHFQGQMPAHAVPTFYNPANFKS